MPAAANSYQIASGMNASNAILVRGAAKRLAVHIGDIATGSLHALTLEGFLGGAAHGASVASTAALWAPITNAQTGSRMVFTTAGGVCLAFATDVVQAFDAVRFSCPSHQLVALPILAVSKAG